MAVSFSFDEIIGLWMAALLSACVASVLWDSLGDTQEELPRLVERAFSEGRCLSLSYTTRQGEQRRRTAEVYGILVELPAWYLLTVDRSLGETRLFRFDRIRQARLLTARFDPESRDAYQEWLTSRGYT